MKISTKYKLPGREINFVNINLDKDNKLFIDPMKLKRGKTEFHQKCFSKVEEFVNILVDLAKNRNYKVLLEFVENFYERNETRLGYSIESRNGKSFGQNGGIELVKLLTKGTIFEAGFIEDIFDFLMLTPNIGEDKVSDIITTILFMDLIEYTQKQCEMWKIPTKSIGIKKLCWNHSSKAWQKIVEELPTHEGEQILFVPKSFVGKSYIFSYEKLYSDVIIPLYKNLEMRKENSRFVVKYKNGRVHVLGNKLRQEYPCTKYVVLDFIRNYDLAYREYKNIILAGKRIEHKAKIWYI